MSRGQGLLVLGGWWAAATPRGRRPEGWVSPCQSPAALPEWKLRRGSGAEAARVAAARREAWSASVSSGSEVRVRGVEIMLLLVVLATAVASSARWLRVPAPSLLVLAGVLVGFVPCLPTVQIAPD